MSRTPSAVWIVDTNKEHLAVEEARKLKIPIIAILDSNCDPDLVDYPIPGNDDAIRAVGLLTRVIADAVADGLIARSGAKTDGDAKGIGTDEPLADWERDLLQGQEAEKVEKAAVAATGGDTATEDPGRRGDRRLSEAPRRRGRRGDQPAEAAEAPPPRHPEPRPPRPPEPPAAEAAEAPAAEAPGRGHRRCRRCSCR